MENGKKDVYAVAKIRAVLTTWMDDAMRMYDSLTFWPLVRDTPERWTLWRTAYWRMGEFTEFITDVLRNCTKKDVGFMIMCLLGLACGIIGVEPRVWLAESGVSTELQASLRTDTPIRNKACADIHMLWCALRDAMHVLEESRSEEEHPDVALERELLAMGRMLVVA
jgi:hypothetical protein